MIDSGLLAVNRALSFAKCANASEVPNCLGICIDAYETAGQLDEALACLHELIEWKKRSVDAEIMGSQVQDLADSVQLQTATSPFDDGLLAKVHSLHAGVQSRLEHLLEIAVNAEISSGHDLYRPFRVANLARHLAASQGWDHQRIASLVLGAQLCNIGMIAIPARILVRPDQLSEGERVVLRGHTSYGAELLRKSKLQVLEIAAVIAEQHHERYDGSGYPRALSGEAIAEEARIVAICDAFDAMTHKKPSKRTPLSGEIALNELAQGAGSQFDPLLVTSFVDLIRNQFSKYEDLDTFLIEGAHEFEYVRARARMESLLAETR